MKDVEGILLTDQHTDIGDCRVTFATENGLCRRKETPHTDNSCTIYKLCFLTIIKYLRGSNDYFLFIGLVNSAKLPSTLRSYAYPLFQVWHICVTLRILNLSNSLLLLLNHKYIMIPCTICHLSGQSYIEFQTMKHAEHKTEITLEFKTLRYDGQLLYTEQVWGILGLVKNL